MSRLAAAFRPRPHACCAHTFDPLPPASPACRPRPPPPPQVKAEIDDLRAEATRLLDLQLTKSADAIRKDHAAAMAALQRKLEAAKGTKWAAKFQEDLAFVSWFDGAVAADPANGPRAAAA
jgi:hypothetical protein